MSEAPSNFHWRGELTVALIVVVGGVIAVLVAALFQRPAAPAPEVHNTVIVPPPVEAAITEVEPEGACVDEPDSSGAGWGPARADVPWGTETDFVIFNSARDNPEFGDERNFFVVRMYSGGGGPWSDRVQVERGLVYEVRILVHNNGPSLPGQAAQLTAASIALPTCTGRQIHLNALVTASGASPERIWDGVTFAADEPFNLVPVTGSAVVYTPTHPEGLRIGNTYSLFSYVGVTVGHDSLDGVLPGGPDAAVAVVVQLRPQFAPEP